MLTGRPSTVSVASVATTTTKDSPLTKNPGTTPKRAMISPPTAGPRMRAMLNAAELRATAFITS